MQFIGYSLLVHQFVTVPWDFNPVPYCQPSHGICTFPVFGMACLAWSEVNVQYYLTHSWEDKGVYTFPKGICLKVNIIARLEFELVIYYDSEAHRYGDPPVLLLSDYLKCVTDLVHFFHHNKKNHTLGKGMNHLNFQQCMNYYHCHSSTRTALT